MMKKKVKFLKDALGASIMEVIFVLGIMAVLTPVVFKYAFKDLSDIKYINMAKQFKQLIKTLAAFTSTEMASLPEKDTPDNLGKEKLESYQLNDIISEDLYDNLSLKYKKTSDGIIEFYGIVETKDILKNDIMAFKKTMAYVGDHIGSVSEEGCVDCSDSNGCICAVSGSWGIPASSLGLDKTNRFMAVIRIDNALLEDEFASSMYLYRNRVDDGKNVMEQNFDFSGCHASDGTSIHCNIKDVRDAKVLASVRGVVVDGTEKYPSVKSKKTTITGTGAETTKVLDSIRFREAVKDEGGVVTTLATLSFQDGGTITVPQIIFEVATVLESFIVENATLLSGRYVTTNPIINISERLIFSGFDLQELSAVKISDGDKINKILGFNPDVGEVVEDSNSRLHISVPKINIINLSTKVLSVNGGNMFAQKTESGVTYTVNLSSSGIIKINNSSFVIKDIKGTPNGVNIWSLIDTFDTGMNTGLKAACKIGNKGIDC